MLGLFKIGIVLMALTDAGLTIAGTAGGAVNNPPVIDSTPDPIFTQGVASTYDMSQDFTDDGQSVVITSLVNILPNGLSYNGDTHILSYDGIALSSVSQHQLQVDDQVNPVVTSFSFDITIRILPTIDTIPDLVMVIAGTHDVSQYITDPDNVITGSNISGSLGKVSYSHATKLLTADILGLEPNLELHVTGD